MPGGFPGLREQFDLVTADRSGPGCDRRMRRPVSGTGGLMVVSEPPDADPGSDRWPSSALEELGLQPSTRVRFNDAFGYQVLVSGKRPRSATRGEWASNETPAVLKDGSPGARATEPTAPGDVSRETSEQGIGRIHDGSGASHP